jgi:hypothetical protein
LNTISEIGKYINSEYLLYQSFYNKEAGQINALISKIKQSYFFIIGASSLINNI